MKRSVRLEPTVITKNKKGTHCVIYVFVCVVIVLIIGLIFSTYEFSIHQPDFGSSNIDVSEQVHVIQRNPLQRLVSKHAIISPQDNINTSNTSTHINTTHDVSNLQYKYKFESTEKWELQKSNGDKCQGTFGNGFSKEIISCSTDKSEFKCVQNPFSNQMYCYAKNLIIDPTQFQVSNGGEKIADVAGRWEDNEFPKYLKDDKTASSAFNIGCQPNGKIPRLDGVSYFMHKIITFLHNMNTDDVNNPYRKKYNENYDKLCMDSNSDDSTLTLYLFTMRYEYANMYHQATDWYNTYQLIHSLGINQDYNVIFLDGHAKSSIDDAWKYAFNGYQFIKQLNNNKGPICMKNALFVSAGYVGGISLRSQMRGCKMRESKYVQGFGPWFLSGFGLLPTSYRNNNKVSITLVCRKNYVAHPRNMGGRATRKFGNEENVERKINDAVQSLNDIEFNIRRVHWSDYTFGQQLEISSSTDMLIGVHGAGLSHSLFLPLNSVVIEIVPAGFEAEPHFEAFTRWCGHKYLSVDGGSEYKVTVRQNRFGDTIRDGVNHILNHKTKNE